MESSALGTDKQAHTNNLWQLQMFRRTLKKQQKLRTLLDVAGSTEGGKCLLVTCGDNNGAINWHIKQHGGEWSWADAEHDSIAQISEVTGDEVVAIDKENPALPFGAESFDLIMTIDVHEHIREPELLNRELARMVKAGGRVIVTTPNGDGRKLAIRIKKIVGMRPEDYGHYVVGYDVPQLSQQMEEVGLTPYQEASYSRFFTEMLELAINYAYVKVLSKRSQAKVEKGQIAPQNIDQVKSVEKTYKLYGIIYPLFLAISKLDFLDRSPRGYAVIVAAKKE
jgi:2-polyprenyl-3-methyl-5-hydroxy-6-metoxy-1,4-benzoquinol methylase